MGFQPAFQGLRIYKCVLDTLKGPLYFPDKGWGGAQASLEQECIAGLLSSIYFLVITTSPQGWRTFCMPHLSDNSTAVTSSCLSPLK